MSDYLDRLIICLMYVMKLVSASSSANDSNINFENDMYGILWSLEDNKVFKIH